MRLYSTKNLSTDVSFEEAVIKGLPSDNGLFMPKSIPTLPASFFDKIEELSIGDIAFEVSKALIGDEIPLDILEKICYEAANFDAPVVEVSENIGTLELFHGPTLAFKDFGARFMARCMSYFMRNESKPLHILVATSGDTGGAVGHGFLGVKNIHITILYPKGKVSDLQEKQLTTLGQNISAIEVDGNFDDCQHLVKTAFLDEELNKHLKLSSANSINISRLVPQSFYYFFAYAQMKKFGNPVVFSVPSGNFGNLCGGLIAMQMGLPVERFIAATNANRVFTDYLDTGVFTPKASVRTISNAMDVGNPSNFPRTLALLENSFEAVKGKLSGYSYSDEETKEAMKAIHQKHGYIADPHGAVGYLGLQDYFEQNPSSKAYGIFLETAHPAKFIDVVEETLDIKVELPEALAELVDKTKEAAELSTDYDKFRAYLLSEYGAL